MADILRFRGTLRGHGDRVSSVATSDTQPIVLASASHDHRIVIWEVTLDGETPGIHKNVLVGHSEAVSSVALSADGKYCLSGSLDKTLRLWVTETGETRHKFEGHTDGVHSVALSQSQRYILSGGADRRVKLWNTQGVCKWTFDKEAHTEHVGSVAFHPSPQVPEFFVSGGHDGLVKIWESKTCQLSANLVGHTGSVYSVSLCHDGSMCASGGADATVILWDLQESAHAHAFSADSAVNVVCFSPTDLRLAASTDMSIYIFDVARRVVLEEIQPLGPPKGPSPWCISLAWSADAGSLFAGMTNGDVNVYEVLPA